MKSKSVDLLKNINRCSEADNLVFSLSAKIIEAISDKNNITNKACIKLCTAYYNKGEKLGLTTKTQFNENIYYKFKQSTHDLQINYMSVWGS